MKRLISKMNLRAVMMLVVMMLTTKATWADGVNYIDADGSSKSHDATALAGSSNPQR